MVELLVSIAIIGMMASLLLGAMFQAQELARAAKTKSLIVRLNAELLSRYETYRTRRLPIDPNVGREVWGTGPSVTGILTHLGATRALQTDAEYYNASTGIGENGYPNAPYHATSGIQTAIKALAARREMIRREMPDRYQDTLLIHGDNTSAVPYGIVNVSLATPAISNPFTQSLYLTTSACEEHLLLVREYNSTYGFATADWASSSLLGGDGPAVTGLYPVMPALMMAYQRRINANLQYQFQTSGGTTDTILQRMASRNEGAECLHMLLTTANGEDDTGRALFLENEVRDTDNDGMPEFIDGWGRPITWLRWPAGFISPLQPAEDVAHPEYAPLRWDLLNSLRTTPLNRDPLDIRGVAIYLDSTGPYRTPPPADTNGSSPDEAWMAYATGTPENALTTKTESLCPWGWGFATTPLIASAGRDGEFGLVLGKLYPSTGTNSVITTPPTGVFDTAHMRKCSNPYAVHRYQKRDLTFGAAQLGAVIYGDPAGLNGGAQVHGDNIHNHALGTR